MPKGWPGCMRRRNQSFGRCPPLAVRTRQESWHRRGAYDGQWRLSAIRAVPCLKRRPYVIRQPVGGFAGFTASVVRASWRNGAMR